MILLIDNYDSFSYNLFQLVGELEPNIKVCRNDEIRICDIENMKPSHIIISPGPGKPSDAGICEEIIKHFTGRIPILGVCLGHQAICEALGAKVTYAKELMHGKQSRIKVDTNCKLFKGLPDRVEVARYHSLAADNATLPDALKVVGQTRDGEIMAVAHKEYDVYGLQFHPESILTPEGKKIVYNFVYCC